MCELLKKLWSDRKRVIRLIGVCFLAGGLSLPGAVNAGDPFPFPLALPFVDTDGDSYSDAAESAFGSGAGDPGDLPDFSPSPAKPNIVLIYADDMGFSDVSAYGTLFGINSPADTPNMDALADSGVVFTQAHSSNAVCTASRYAILTGKYNWRLFDSITLHYGWKSGTPEIPLPEDETIAEFLKAQGYDTAAFGKWHLGGKWYQPGTNSRITTNPTNPASVDWTRRIEAHATDHGFDYFRGLGTTINVGPYVYMHDDRVQVWDASLDDGYGLAGNPGGFRPATVSDSFVWLTTSQLDSSVIGAKDSRASLGDPAYRQVDAEPIMIKDFEDYMASRITGGDTDPFFAYVSLYSPHKPWAVTGPFDGVSGVPGFDYADFMIEVDDRIGRVIRAIDDNGLGNDTIIILTSDNGPENTAMERSLAFGADSNGPLRGNKRDVWEGGTRVPFIVRWPGQAVPGLVTNELIWQGDIFATIAAYLGAELDDGVAPDGESFLNVLRGQEKPSPRRQSIVVSSVRGDLGLKTIDGWKLIDATGGGNGTSWDSENLLIPNAAGTDQGNPKQLFDLNADFGEDDNRIAFLGSSPSDAQTRSAIAAEAGTDLLAVLDQLRGNFSTAVYPRSPDNDGDSMSNAFEDMHAGLDREDPGDASEDFEPDGLTNAEEAANGVDPNNADSDGDELSDGTEVNVLGTLAGSAHSDGDSVADGDEVLRFGTNPLVADTDGDGVDDGAELAAFSNPRNPAVTPAGAVVTETALDPVVVQVVGVNGNASDPQALGPWPAGDGPGSGSLYVREREVGGTELQWRSRLFLRFDLGGLSGTVESARLRAFQVDRLNDIFDANLELARVTEAWDTSGSNYPVFDGTGVADAFEFGNNADFGLPVDAAGFFGGAPGVVGADDAGFDPGGRVSDLVQGWSSGSFPNHGIRIAFSERQFVGAAFADADDPSTIGVNENLQLLVTTLSDSESLDTDQDRLLDSWERDQGDGSLAALDGAGDEDGDGISNAGERALGSSPFDAGSLPVVTIDPGPSESTRELSFLRNVESGAGSLVLYSEDLSVWAPALPELLQLSRVVDLGNGYEEVVYQLDAQAGQQLFFRVEPVFAN